MLITPQKHINTNIFIFGSLSLCIPPYIIPLVEMRYPTIKSNYISLYLQHSFCRPLVCSACVKFSRSSSMYNRESPLSNSMRLFGFWRSLLVVSDCLAFFSSVLLEVCFLLISYLLIYRLHGSKRAFSVS